ncbi:L,D-transpeptidase [Aestuariivirga litoralis]|uniref:L,D-transpeptidase n=1 Tax=Aestuariivirga litoralis TaxID=2650924 RepID=UPI001FE21616|nr:L,D-transpeptidase [Aestuariivirga litoralis]
MQRRSFLISGAGLAAAAPLLARPAAAQLVNKLAYDLKNGEFNWFPERSEGGPILIIVSIPDQLVHVYRNGIRIAASTCSTGKPGHRTPTGVFQILQKDKHHRSSTYSNAPMPNMNRLTWSGIALHAGNLPGYPASHGCVRLPMQFSELLFDITRKGMTVVIADEHSQPAAVTHPGMVLGDYARREFAAVDTALLKDQYGAGHAAKPTVTSVVVSSRDKSVTVMEDGHVVARGKAAISGGGKPLGENVYTLTGADRADDSLTWSSVGYGKTDREDMGRELRRITADQNVRGEIRKRMQNGMTVVTTDQPNTASHRANDFTILEGVY